MKDKELKWKFVVIAYLTLTIIMAFKIRDLEHKIDEIEKTELEVHEYILNRIGA